MVKRNGANRNLTINPYNSFDVMPNSELAELGYEIIDVSKDRQALEELETMM